MRRLFALAGLLLVGTLHAGTLDDRIRERAEAGETQVDVILRFAAAPPLPTADTRPRHARRAEIVRTLRRHAATHHEALRGSLHKEKATRVRELWATGALALRVPARAAERLSRHPAVASVTLDALLSAPSTSSPGSGTPGWNLRAVGADTLWSLGNTGVGAVVALLDTGADISHPDLADGFHPGVGSWFDPHGQHASPYDAHGHGTQVLGLAVGRSGSGTAIGVAPGAQWIAAKVFDDAGRAQLSDLHLALQWALDPDGDPTIDDVPDVVLAAWGLTSTPGQCVREFEHDIAALRAADVAVVFAAGNHGATPVGGLSPANYSDGLSLGAIDANLSAASFSARGPSACDGGVYPRLVAPGVGVYTTDLTFGGVVPASYTWVSGTSFAAPHAAGVLALLRSALPQASAAQLEETLLASARDLGAPGAESEHGYGIPDASAAYGRLLTMAGREPEGSVSRTAADHRWTRTALPRATLAPPVIIAGPPSFRGTQPGVIQLRRIDVDAAEVRFREWDYLDQWHGSEELDMLALAPGRYHAADGSIWEVGRIQLDGNASFRPFRFQSGLVGTPALFLTVQSSNGAHAVTARARHVTGDGFEAALFEQESLRDGHTTEDVGYLAIQQPRGTGEVSLDGVPRAYTLERAQLDHAFKSVLGGSTRLKLEEEQSADAELWHQLETVDVLGLGSGIFAQDVSAGGRDPVALRRR